MRKKSRPISSTATGLLEIDLSDIPKLQVFALPIANCFDLSIKMEWIFPDESFLKCDKIKKASNCYFAKLSVRGAIASFQISKLSGFSWKYLTKMFGPIVQRFLDAPNGTQLSIEMGSGKRAQRYQGVVREHKFLLLNSQPKLAASTLREAWQLAQLLGAPSFTCVDEVEAETFEQCCSKYKNLRDADLRRRGKQFSSTDNSEHLLGCLFQLRYGLSWQLPELIPKAKPVKSSQTKVRPEASRKSLEVELPHSSVHDVLYEYIVQLTKGSLKSRKLPGASSSHQWYLASGKSKLADAEFARLTVMGDELHLELRPLREQTLLGESVPKKLQKYLTQGVEGIPFTQLNDKTIATLKDVIKISFAWFEVAFINQDPTPVYPIQPKGSYLFEKHAPLNSKPSRLHIADDQDGELEPTFAYQKLATWAPASDSFTKRLVRTCGAGAWQRASLAMRIKLFDWEETCQTEVHWYGIANRGKKLESWRIKSFLKTLSKRAACNMRVKCVTPNDFPASLQIGKSYDCTGRIGKKYIGYLCIVDESKEEYWYPETFFQW